MPVHFDVSLSSIMNGLKGNVTLFRKNTLYIQPIHFDRITLREGRDKNFENVEIGNRVLGAAVLGKINSHGSLIQEF